MHGSMCWDGDVQERGGGEVAVQGGRRVGWFGRGGLAVACSLLACESSGNSLICAWK